MYRIGMAIALCALGCVPQLDDCVDDDGCPAPRTCQSGYCLPADASASDARVRDRGTDAMVPDAMVPDAMVPDARVVDAAVDAAPDAEVPVGRDPCNGEDDDGDSRIDEDFRSADCVVGLGRCSARGTDVCLDGEIECDATPNDALAQAESCNNIDDDCDGAIDEAGQEDLCCETAEVCNGVDDDCDDRVDELPAIGPERQIARHGGGAAKVLRIAATGTHVAVLTHDAPAGRAVLRAYALADLDAPPISAGVPPSDGLPTQMIAHDGQFIIAAPGARSGVEVTRVSIVNGQFVFEDRPILVPGRVDQLVVQAHADGRAAVIAHGDMHENRLYWYTVPVDWGGVGEAVEIEAPRYSVVGGFAAGLSGESLQVVWTSDGLVARTIHRTGMVEQPLQDFGARATRPFMAGLRAPNGDPVLLWQTDPDPANADLVARKVFGGQQANLGPVRGDRPTGAPVDAQRMLVGWRARDSLEGRVSLARLTEQTFEVDAQLATPSARRAPAMAVSGNTLSVVWLAEPGTVHLRHHVLECPAEE